MPVGERSKLQLVPPRGIKRKNWVGHRMSSGPPSKHKPGKFSISCGVRECYYRQSSTGDAANDHSVKCGVKGPLVCPNGHTFPVRGYV